MKISKTDILIFLKRNFKSNKSNSKDNLIEKTTTVGKYIKNANACQNNFLIY